VLALVSALRQLLKGPRRTRYASAGPVSRTAHRPEKLGTDKQAWSDWFSKAYPDPWQQSWRLAGTAWTCWGMEQNAWRNSLVNRQRGERGRAVFVKTKLCLLPSGHRSWSPDLARRRPTAFFSRDDLFKAIRSRARDISPRYGPRDSHDRRQGLPGVDSIPRAVGHVIMPNTAARHNGFDWPATRCEPRSHASVDEPVLPASTGPPRGQSMTVPRI